MINGTFCSNWRCHTFCLIDFNKSWLLKICYTNTAVENIDIYPNGERKIDWSQWTYSIFCCSVFKIANVFWTTDFGWGLPTFIMVINWLSTEQPIVNPVLGTLNINVGWVKGWVDHLLFATYLRYQGIYLLFFARFCAEVIRYCTSMQATWV